VGGPAHPNNLIMSLNGEIRVLDATLPAGGSFSRVCRRGTALTLVDLLGGASVAALFYRAEDPLERYCMPDTLKAQHVSRVTSGVALYSDMGRVLASIVEDTCGWHDTITGHMTPELLAARWGARSYQDARNECRRSARELLLVELAKHGLDRRDLVANVNFFTKIAIGDDGELSFDVGNSSPGSEVRLRFELDTLVVLASAPHPLDPSEEFEPRPVQLRVERIASAAPGDAVRTACAENERGFRATEAALC
jgi:urea carboxylase-associated protein 2